MTRAQFERYEPHIVNHLLINEDTRVEIDRTTLWRSTAPRLQTYRVYGHAWVHAHVRDGLVAVLDDALAIHEDLYCETRSQMLADYDFYARPTYDQECLAAYLTRHHMTQRLFVYPDRRFAREPATRIGEADLKVCWYIDMALYQRYLIVSQDTDLICILLLHCKRLLNAEGRLPDELELWIDSQTPADAKEGRSRPYRFIDVKALYNAILELFAREYPAVANPVETFLFLFYIVKTDYTKPFHKSLGVTWRVVWDTFSELHCANKAGWLRYNDNCYDEADPRAMGVVLERARESYLPRALHGLLNECVTLRYEPQSDAHQVALDEVAVQRFLYLLCELRVRHDLVAIGHTEYDNKLDNRYILDVDELFMKIVLLEDNVARCRSGALAYTLKSDTEKERERAFRAALADVKDAVIEFKARPVDEQRALPPLPPSERDTIDMDAIGMPGKASRRPRSLSAPQQQARVTDLSRVERPPQWGVPALQRMLAHIYRQEFVMNYHQNGWLAPEHALCFAEPHPNNPTLSRHGWRQREIPQTDEAVARGDFNSVYYATQFVHGPPQPGVLPFRIYETVECDEVYIRRHEHYATVMK